MVRAIASRASVASGRSSRNTLPALGRISPASTRSSVDLPAAFGPMSATASPAPTASETPCSTCAAATVRRDILRAQPGNAGGRHQRPRLARNASSK